VLKFTGDGLLAIFPVKGRGRKKACESALRAAQEVQRRLTDLATMRKQRELPTTPLGIGLHIGEVMYGNIGAPSRLDFTVIGSEVNLTARIQQIPGSVDHDAVMSEAFVQLVTNPTIPLGEYELKGVPQPVTLYALA